MKKFIYLSFAVLSWCSSAYAQNTFPSTGNVGVGTSNPATRLSIGTSVANPTTGSLLLSGSTSTSAQLIFEHTNGGTNEKLWDFLTDSKNFYGRVINDENSAASPWINVSRSGTGVSAVTFPNGNFGIGTNYPNARFQVNSNNPGTGTSTTNWIAGSFGGQAGNRVVLGTLYGTATLGAHNDDLTAWSNLAINVDGGNVGIGTVNPDAKLAVKGTIHTQEVKVDMNGWADYVFKPTYKLPSLKTIKAYINKNQHLPDMPSEAEVAKYGVNLGEMNKLLLKKVEELTLYMIEKDKALDMQQQSLLQQEACNKKQQKELLKLKKQMIALVKASSQKQ